MPSVLLNTIYKAGLNHSQLEIDLPKNNYILEERKNMADIMGCHSAKQTDWNNPVHNMVVKSGSWKCE